MSSWRHSGELSGMRLGSWSPKVQHVVVIQNVCCMMKMYHNIYVVFFQMYIRYLYDVIFICISLYVLKHIYIYIHTIAGGSESLFSSMQPAASSSSVLSNVVHLAAFSQRWASAKSMDAWNHQLLFLESLPTSNKHRGYILQFDKAFINHIYGCVWK